MATSTTRRARPVRTLVILAVLIAALFGALFAGTKLDARTSNNPSGASLTPGLALDLEGGTQIILRPIAEDGAKVTSDTIDQAISVIRQRIDSSGVAEAEITSQGQGNIVVGIPGEPSQETIDLVKTSAQMRFRPVLAVSGPQPAEAEANADGTSPTDVPTPAPTESPSAAPTDGASAPTDNPTSTPRPEDPSDLAQITPELQAEFDKLDCTDPANLTGGSSGPDDAAFIACAQDGTAKYILGPVEVDGTNIDQASSGLGVGPNGVTTNEWVVSMKLDSKGTDQFAETSERLLSLPSPQNQFAIVLDGLVVSAPRINQVIANGQAEISGNFTRESSATLANQLSFGALPLTFEVQSQEQISATLGSEQLQKGLIAGLIGLVLVVLYSMVQYRALGLVTVASLVIAAVITYGVIAMLSWIQGYRLSLPGVAGLIVAIGITADSFIVYFERIRDELRDGRSLPLAVEKGWARARRTIVASDAVNFLAAIVLYLLAVGGVRGFAFTLGLTTLVDLVVVFLFTHPVLQLISRTKFFAEGHSFSGLDPRRLGVRPRYAGRGRVAVPSVGGSAVASEDDSSAASLLPTEEESSPTEARRAPTQETDGPRMTIAERRAAERRAAQSEASDEPATAADDEEKH